LRVSLKFRAFDRFGYKEEGVQYTEDAEEMEDENNQSQQGGSKQIFLLFPA
jgi:hypothetical protein